MDFHISQEQQMLLDSTRRLIEKEYPFARREQVRASPQGWSRETWNQLAELGLLALTIPEHDDGIGAGPIGTMLVSTAIGEGLLLEPFHASAVVATQAIAQLGDVQQRQRWLPSMASGQCIAVLAHDERFDSTGSMPVRTQARSGNGQWCLTGSKHAVYHADCADLLLVSARIDDSEELGVFALPAHAEGVELRRFRTIDDQRAADVSLRDVRVEPSQRLGGDASVGLQMASAFGLAALCAETLGALDRILAATIQYSAQRVQFGAPIGSFQSLQHRMADMQMHVEQARSMAYLAACRCSSDDRAVRDAALAAAKVSIGQAARFVGQQAVQIHGGMGMTDELDVSHYFRRLTAFELRGGPTDWHLRRYARQLAVA